MYLIVIFFPLFLSLIGLNRKIGLKSLNLAILGNLINLILISIIYYEVFLQSSEITINLNYWLEYLNIEWKFVFDSLTINIYFLIGLISTFILIYSKEYLNGDPHIIRFFSYLFLQSHWIQHYWNHLLR